ncbi:nuclear transport factor 2 family protein [Parapedobacter pyrenivorans]|uniref:nuclear transport factor 2 family protein n=1 Tax=Parapedobacter pyrenivorans TaxID=1305674 RepID=UPI0033425272
MSCNTPNKAVVSEEDVAAAVESFRKVMLNPDQAAFEALFHESLTYGHSNGLVESQETCIASMVSGKFKFTSLAFSQQTTDIVGNTAIVRLELFGQTHDAGKEPGEVHLKVMMVWVQDSGKLRLIARQAVKI